MSQLSNNNQLSDANGAKPQLCRQCCEFFGNQSTDFLCSKCFKERSKMTTATIKAPITLENNVVPVIEKIEEEKVNPVEIKAEEVKKEQVDPKKCFACPKKVGAIGHQCKCGFTFCKSHRLPEDHECTYNFREEAAKKLAKENPLVVAAKMEKI